MASNCINVKVKTKVSVEVPLYKCFAHTLVIELGVTGITKTLFYYYDTQGEAVEAMEKVKAKLELMDAT